MSVASLIELPTNDLAFLAAVLEDKTLALREPLVRAVLAVRGMTFVTMHRLIEFLGLLIDLAASFAGMSGRSGKRHGENKSR